MARYFASSGPVYLVLSMVASGCAGQLRDVGRPPDMSPVGSGMQMERVGIIADRVANSDDSLNHSTWRDRSSDFFRDARAVRKGDVLTVKISIKDKASFDSTAVRARDSKLGLQSKTDLALDAFGLSKKGSGSLDTSSNSTTSTNGSGAVTRAESIDLLVAATVTEVLPNGNLVISGAQEVRVNFEVRVLSVAGIVRPRDIATDNSISYEKIAEARIAYGGRGRIMEVLQRNQFEKMLSELRTKATIE